MNNENNNSFSCNCTEANCFCDKYQYNEAATWEVNQLQKHLKQCPKCKDYSEKNTKLTLLLNKVKQNSLSKEDREEIKQELQKVLQEKNK